MTCDSEVWTVNQSQKNRTIAVKNGQGCYRLTLQDHVTTKPNRDRMEIETKVKDTSEKTLLSQYGPLRRMRQKDYSQWT